MLVVENQCAASRQSFIECPAARVSPVLLEMTNPSWRKNQRRPASQGGIGDSHPVPPRAEPHIQGGCPDRLPRRATPFRAERARGSLQGDRWAACVAQPGLRPQDHFALQRLGNRLRNLILNLENVVHHAVVAVGPHLITARHVTQMDRHAHPLAGPADASHQHVVDTQPTAGYLNLRSLALELKRRIVRGYAQAFHFGEGEGDVFDYSLGEELAFRVPVHIGERQNGYRRLRARPRDRA